MRLLVLNTNSDDENNVMIDKHMPKIAQLNLNLFAVKKGIEYWETAMLTHQVSKYDKGRKLRQPVIAASHPIWSK